MSADLAALLHEVSPGDDCLIGPDPDCLRCQTHASLLAAAGVTVAPALDVERLREAAQAVVDAWDEDAMPEEDGFDPMVNSIAALRAALATGDEP